MHKSIGRAIYSNSPSAAPSVCPDGTRQWTVPQSTPVSLPGLEDQILADAQSRLEAQLESECRQQFGLDAVIRVILEQDGQTLQAVRASMTVPAGSSTALCREAADYLQQRLGVEPSLQTEEETGT